MKGIPGKKSDLHQSARKVVVVVSYVIGMTS